MCTDWESRHKTVFLHRQHDRLCGRSGRINQNTPETNKRFLQDCRIQGKCTKFNCFSIYQQ